MFAEIRRMDWEQTTDTTPTGESPSPWSMLLNDDTIYLIFLSCRGANMKETKEYLFTMRLLDKSCKRIVESAISHIFRFTSEQVTEETGIKLASDPKLNYEGSDSQAFLKHMYASLQMFDSVFETKEDKYGKARPNPYGPRTLDEEARVTAAYLRELISTHGFWCKHFLVHSLDLLHQYRGYLEANGMNFNPRTLKCELREDISLGGDME